jgi:DNA-binding HxlR family transcriptional regulator
MREQTSACGVTKSLSIIGKKWRIEILWQLSYHSVLRYNALKRELDGITNTTLNRALEDLQKYKLISRKEFEVIPPHVEYSLTKEGKKLIPALEIINNWGHEMMEKGIGSE